MNVLILPGDGIGPEICAATRAALEAIERRFALGLAFTEAAIGLDSLARTGTTLPPAVVRRARAADAVILGPVSHNAYPPVAEGGLNPSGELRRQLDLYANIRPSYTRPGVPAMARAMDLVIVRENTEGFYADRNMAVGSGEFMPTRDVALAVRKITRRGCRRIIATGFAWAARRRKRLTAIHKANVLRLSDGLFLEEFARAARRNPRVATDALIVDAAAAHLVRTPERFDVLVTTNMFGDILSDEAAELAGSLGLAESLNHGDRHGVAQAAHGSAPDIAGRDLANPTALMLSAALLLDWLAARKRRPALAAAGRALRDAVDGLLADPKTRTRDLKGRLGCAAFADAVTRRIGDARRRGRSRSAGRRMPKAS